MWKQQSNAGGIQARPAAEGKCVMRTGTGTVSSDVSPRRPPPSEHQPTAPSHHLSFPLLCPALPLALALACYASTCASFIPSYRSCCCCCCCHRHHRCRLPHPFPPWLERCLARPADLSLFCLRCLPLRLLRLVVLLRLYRERPESCAELLSCTHPPPPAPRPRLRTSPI